MLMLIDEILVAAEDLIKAGKIKQAYLTLEQLYAQNPENIAVQVLYARCCLAQGNEALAYKIYKHLSLAKAPEYDEARPEALLALGKYNEALLDYEGSFKRQKRPGRMLFPASLAAYKNGVVIKSLLLLKQAVSKGYEWEDNTSIDLLARHVLEVQEFTDFEELYIDADEQVENHAAGNNNRWMSMNIPIYEFLHTPAKQKQNAALLLDILGAGEFASFLENGKAELETMLHEITDIETDARFGLEAQKQLQDNQFPALSGLLLALLLEQTSRYCKLFSLEQEFVKSSQLQELIVLLPLKIATALLFLFSIANPLQQNQESIQKIDENTMAGLIALCVISYNREIKKIAELRLSK